MKFMSLKVKLILVLVLMAMTLAVPAVQTTRQGVSAAPAAQTCSGDDCGCGIIAHACIDACSGNLECIRQCRRCWIECSMACCGAPRRQ